MNSAWNYRTAPDVLMTGKALDVEADTSVPKLPFAFGGPCCRALLRFEPEDFRVDEVSLVEPDGKGEHVLLWIEKRNTNTDWVAGLLARLAKVSRRDVGYAGKKDRRALTRQWFSVRLPGIQEPDWTALDSTEIQVLRAVRHSRKLRAGALKGNQFVIRARGLEGDSTLLAERLGCLAHCGMPNYFGEQRFGREGSNLKGVLSMFDGSGGRLSHQKRGLYLSAARSLLFNKVLSRRVTENNWNQPLEGERLILDGSRNSFLPDQIDTEILRRVSDMDIHPSGPLWGRGDLQVTGEAERLEREALASMDELCNGLERFGLKQERRSLRTRVLDLSWTLAGGDLELSFFLAKGSYATAMLRECLDYRVATA